jgi:dTDP-4-amino-4,6-dideoxygalactose transaminase
LQGAVLRVKLKHLEAWTETRRRLAGLYTRALADSGLQLPVEMEWARHVYHVYCVATDHRDDLLRTLAAREIQTMIYYPFPLHLTEPYRDPNFPAGSLLVAERAAKRVLALPIYPEMPEAAVEEVAAAIAVTAAA